MGGPDPLTYSEVVREAPHIEDGAARVQMEEVVQGVWMQLEGGKKDWTL